MTSISYLNLSLWISSSIFKNFRLLKQFDVSISLEKATAERKFIIPEYIKKELELNGVLDTYLKQPNYLKREQVNYIEVAKKEETKINRLKKLIERLST